MISIDYHPTKDWSQTERNDIALRIKSAVDKRQRAGQHLTPDEILNVIDRLTFLIGANATFLEANRTGILGTSRVAQGDPFGDGGLGAGTRVSKPRIHTGPWD